MLNITLIKFILKTGCVTLLLVVGIYMLCLSRTKLAALAANLFGVRDLEITTGNVVFLKVMGSLMTIAGIVLIWFFFLYDPSAAAAAAKN